MNQIRGWSKRTDPRSRDHESAGHEPDIGIARGKPKNGGGKRRHKRPNAALILASASMLSVVCTSSNSHAYHTLAGSPTRAGGAATFYIDTQSFVSNMAIPSLTEDDYENWITWTMSNWRERTGANLSITYSGRMPDYTCGTHDGTDVVVAQNVCGDDMCDVLADTPIWINGSNQITEADVCVYAPTFAWATQSNSFPVDSFDPIGVLEHEFGHYWGLDHTDGTVMQATNLPGTLARYPFGDDIDGIRALYGGRTETKVFKQFDPSGNISSSYTVGGDMDMHGLAAAGYDSSENPYLVTTRLNPGGDSVHFTRASNYSTPTTWTNRFLNYSSWRPPAVAYGAGIWLGAWTNQSVTLGCPGVMVAASTDVFDSATVYSLPSVCTIHEPTIAYDPDQGEFIMTYATRAFDESLSENDMIMATMSPDGASWSTPIALDTYTIDAPDIACSDNGTVYDCAIQYAGGNDPTPFVYADLWGKDRAGFNYGARRINYNFAPRTPAVATNSAGVDWLSTLTWGSTAANVANDQYSIYTDYGLPDAYAPPVYWVFLDSSRHRAAVAGNVNSNYNYVFYVQ